MVIGGGGVIPQEYTSSIISVRVINNGSFVNDVTGLIKLGVGEDGNTSSYLNVGSAAIQAYSNGTAINDGRIILGSKADGVYGLMGVGNNVNLVNNGTIDVNSDGDNGLYTPAKVLGFFQIIRSTVLSTTAVPSTSMALTT